ncbi:MAG: MBL fold metallo-hydrolase [Acidimicrobiales bacterium]
MTPPLVKRPAPLEGDLAVRWIHGAPRRRTGDDPPVQVHWYDAHTAIIRQSKAVSYEAPFLYLLFGNDRAILWDTGATGDASRFPLRATVDELVTTWLEAHPQATPGYELVVAHTHGHGDHVAGDGQFADRPATTVVAREIDAVVSFFGFADWPGQTVTFELGARQLELTGAPGHHPAALAVYDPWTGFLLTGDTVYPGRLYVPDFPAFVDTMDRLDLLSRRRPVTHVMGCHIEMRSEPGRDYPIGATYQPSEPPLQMTVDQLREVRQAAHDVAARPGVHRFPDFIIYNGPCRRQIAFQLARSLVARLRYPF